jgi:hypothetical protein
MCNLDSITTKQAAIIGLFRVINCYVGNLAPMLGVFPDYPAPVVRNTEVVLIAMEHAAATAHWRSHDISQIVISQQKAPAMGGFPVARQCY